MRWFIKLERFTEEAVKLSPKARKEYIKLHSKWVKDLSSSGVDVYSGYLTNKERTPGGGGLLLLKASSYEIAQKIVMQDPMIINKLVTWELHEWIKINNQNPTIIEDTTP